MLRSTAPKTLSSERRLNKLLKDFLRRSSLDSLGELPFAANGQI